MEKLYEYRILKQDGSVFELEVREKMTHKEMREVLKCEVVRLIPTDYYIRRGYGNCSMFMDKRAYCKPSNKRNPFFNVITNYLEEWDVVGDVLEESLYKGEVCAECGKADYTVQTRVCGYNQDVNNTEVMETVCDDCEHEHLMDI